MTRMTTLFGQKTLLNILIQVCILSFLFLSEVRGISVIRVVTNPSQHFGVRYPRHHHDGQNEHLIQNLISAGESNGGGIQNLLRGSRSGPSFRDGGLRRGGISGLTSRRSNIGGDFEDLLQNFGRSHQFGSGGGESLSEINVGDLRDLFQRGPRGGGEGSTFSGSGLNSRGLQSLLQGRGRGSFGNGQTDNFNSFRQSGFPGGGGNNFLRGRGPLMQLILDEGRFILLGTRILLHKRRLFSDLVSNVFNGVSNFTDRVIGEGSEFSIGGGGGSSGGGFGQLNPLLSQPIIGNGGPSTHLQHFINQGHGLGEHYLQRPEHVHCVDIISHHHNGPYRVLGHGYDEDHHHHEHRGVRSHRRFPTRGIKLPESDIGQEQDSRPRSQSDSKDYEGASDEQGEHNHRDEINDSHNSNGNHLYNGDKHETTEAEGRSSLSSVLNIPPFKRMPDWFD